MPPAPYWIIVLYELFLLPVHLKWTDIAKIYEQMNKDRRKLHTKYRNAISHLDYCDAARQLEKRNGLRID